MPNTPATHEETKARVAAREASVELLALIAGECEGKPLVFRERLWQLVRERAITEVGLPKRAAVEVEPLSDKQADAFRDCAVVWGKYRGRTIGEIEQCDPDYLAFIADGTDFTRQLRRYLARSKYSDAED